jgi:hypothetical protein
MQTLRTIKRLAAGMCVLAAVAAVSMPSKAQALSFPNGDLAFVVYGGSSEFYQDLGSISSILSNPTTTLNLTPQQLTDVTTGASLGIKFTLLGTSADGTQFLTGGPGTITGGQKATTDWLTGEGQVQGWSALLGSISGGTTANNPLTLLASNQNSFTSMLGSDGRLSGTMGFSVAAGSDQTLSLYSIMTDVGSGNDVYTKVATALFTANGQLTITPGAAPVPIPAAVVLFGSGLVALVGIARRKVMGRAA